MNNLARINCQTLPGVGPKIANYLAKCGIHTLQDLLFHLPLRYENRSQITPIMHATPGTRVLIKGTLQAHSLAKPRKGFTCRLLDKTGSLGLRFFHLSRLQLQGLKEGVSLLCFGEIRSPLRRPLEREMVHPDYQFLSSHQEITLPDHLIAIYPSTQGLTQRILHKLIQQVFSLLATPTNHQTKQSDHWFPDYLNDKLLKTLHLPNLLNALSYLHKPPLDAPLLELNTGKHQTQQRLILEELLAHSLSLRSTKKNRQQETAPPLRISTQAKVKWYFIPIFFNISSKEFLSVVKLR